MRIGFYQFAPHFGRRSENIDRIVSALEKAEADLVVLPELCTSGYQFKSADEVAEAAEDPLKGPTAKALQDLCSRKGLHVVAGIAENASSRIFNAAILSGPSGTIGIYRKVHLFADEKGWFSPGDIPFDVHRIAGCTVGMMICFDWIFPESARALALLGADVICHPANLVLPYCQDAMIVRCLENRVFAITANRTGKESRRASGSLEFTGRSQVVSPRGDCLLRASADGETVETIDINPAESSDKRVTVRNDLFEDRRPELYRTLCKG